MRHIEQTEDDSRFEGRPPDQTEISTSQQENSFHTHDIKVVYFTSKQEFDNLRQVLEGLGVFLNIQVNWSNKRDYKN